MDQEVIQIRRRLAPDYERTDGRHDPFEVETLERLIKNQSDSILLKRKIVTLNDALDHAEAVVTAWAKEDADLEVYRQKRIQEQTTRNNLNVLPMLPELPKLVAPKGTHMQQVRFARDQWHAAVEWRKQVDAQAKEYVAEASDLYKGLRGVS